ncbi:splicing regulatory glutamine/lysine-rich protein 1-like [Salvia divinorum]|uniref:Splicing regulatory glutamine/lysine-rich protein 1-like n=1 Tax=Salvia divinorum TaxID=28513 RepID=A0ABD1GLQ4_SALDI
MPPRTRSQGLAETHSEGGVGPSHSKPEGDLLSMMTQMWADLKNEIRSDFNGLQSDMTGVRNDLSGIRSDVKEFEIRKQATHNNLFEEINVLKRNRFSRPTIPRENHIPNVILKAYNGDEGYDDGYARNRSGNWGNDRLGMKNEVHGHFGNENGRNGDWRYEDYKSYGGYSREMHGGGDDESRYHSDGLDRRSRREQVTRIQEESHLRRNEEYERLKEYERPLERDALCRVRGRSSSRHGDSDNTQSRITPWKTDTYHPIASPKSSFESLMEQSQRVIPSRNEKHHDLKYGYFGYEAKEEGKYKACDPLREEREREKRLESECQIKEPREHEKR